MVATQCIIWKNTSSIRVCKKWKIVNLKRLNFETKFFRQILISSSLLTRWNTNVWKKPYIKSNLNNQNLGAGLTSWCYKRLLRLDITIAEIWLGHLSTIKFIGECSNKQGIYTLFGYMLLLDWVLENSAWACNQSR